MAESVGTVHAELTGGSAKFTQALDQGKTALRGFTGEMRQQMAAGRTATAGQSGEITKLGNVVKGAGPSIAGMSSALMLMGTKASPAIRSLGTAVSSLMMGGFAPLGIAIGLATAAIGLFVTGTKEVSASTAAANVELSKLQQRVFDVQLAARAAAANRSTEAQREFEDIVAVGAHVEALRRQIDDNVIAIAKAEVEVTRLRRELLDPRAATGDLAAAQAQLGVLQRRLDADRESLQIYESQADYLQLAARAERERAAATRETAEALAEVAKALDVTMPFIESDRPPGTEEWLDRKEAWRRYLAAQELEAQMILAGELLERNAPRPFEEPLPGGGLTRAARLAREKADREKYLDTLRDTAKEQRDLFNAIMDMSRPTFSEGFTERFDEMSESMLSAGAIGAQTAETLQHGFATLFSSIASGSVSASQAMRRFALSVLDSVNQLLANQLAAQLIGAFVSAIQPGAVDALGRPAPAGTNVGNDPLAQGIGRVGIEKKMAIASGAGASPLTVNVYNYSSATVAQRIVDGPRGPELHVVIEEIVSKSFRDGGRAGRAAESAFGLTRRGRRN